MWEAIEANKRKAMIIFFTMGFFLLAVGYFIGRIWFGLRHGGVTGALLAGGIWLVWSYISFYYGDDIILSANGATEVTRAEFPQLFNIVNEMTIAANMSNMPRVYVLEMPMLNAFATGRDISDSSIAVTRAMLEYLNRDELQGVIAHEISHIINRDILLLTFAQVMVGMIELICEAFWRVRIISRDSDSDSENSSASMISTLVGFVAILIAPIATTFMYFAISRKREYLADATAVRLTRNPEGLANALEKIQTTCIGELPSLGKISAPLYIHNPLGLDGDSVDWTSTHPPINKRIEILRQMAGKAGYVEYQAALKRVMGQ
jgi:heat shock protein HtpX